MNILVVTGSPRKGGNTEILADAFAQAAKESGHEVTVRKLSRLKVGPCLACEYCFTHDGVCVQNDDMNEILLDVHKADMLVLASPMAARVPLLLHQQTTHRKARDSRHLLQAKVETVDRIHRTHREPSRQKDRESAALRTSVQSSVLMPDLTSTTDLPRSR